MATRAIDDAEVAKATAHRLSGWRETFDASFMAAWDRLADHAVEPNAFAESWFLQAALEHFDNANQVQIFTLWRDDELCGLMPLSAQPRYGRWPMPHVQNWLHHNAFLGTPLVLAGYEQEFWQALLGFMDADPGSALFLHLNSLTANGVLAKALQTVCAKRGHRYAMVHKTTRAFLESDLSPEAFLATAVRTKKQKELRRQRKRLSEEGALIFARNTDGAGLTEWTQEFLALEQRGWKGRNGSALGCSDATAALFVKVLAGAALVGKLERLDLRLDGRPLAMLVNFRCPPGSFSFKTAFDEDYARFSPGVLLQIENLALLAHPEIAWCDSCAVEGHPMIDSLWTGRRAVGRYSVAIGGSGRRAIFKTLLKAELSRSAARESQIDAGEDE